jgi:hypothetical protein
MADIISISSDSDLSDFAEYFSDDSGIIIDDIYLPIEPPQEAPVFENNPNIDNYGPPQQDANQYGYAHQQPPVYPNEYFQQGFDQYAHQHPPVYPNEYWQQPQGFGQYAHQQQPGYQANKIPQPEDGDYLQFLLRLLEQVLASYAGHQDRF